MSEISKIKKSILKGNNVKVADIKKVISSQKIRIPGGINKLKKNELLEVTKTILKPKKDIINQINLLADSKVGKNSKIKKNELVKQLLTERNDLKKQIQHNEEYGYEQPIRTQLNNFDHYVRYRVVYDALEGGNANEMYAEMLALKRTLEQQDPEYEYVVKNLVIYVYEDDGSRTPMHFSIPAADFNDADDLDAIFEKLETNDYEGSDRVKEGQHIEFSRFDVMFLKLDRNNRNVIEGLTDMLCLFKTHNVSSRGFCGYESLKLIYPDLELTKKEYSDNNLKEVNNFLNYVKLNFPNINIILASIRYDLKLFTKTDDQEIFINPKNKRERTLYKLHNNEFVEFIYLNDKVEKSDGTLLIDINNKHCDVILDNKIEFDNIYFDNGYSFYKKIDDELFQLEFDVMKMIKDNIIHKTGAVKTIQKEDRYIFFDYETIIDWSEDNILKAYGLSFLDLNLEELEELEKIDSAKDEDELIKFINNHVKTIISFNATQSLYDYMCRSNNIVYSLVSFNGAKFDNYILYHDLSKIGCDVLNSAFFNGSQLLTFKIGNHETFDLAKHITNCNLEQACKDYGIKICSKKSFDHREAQKLYDEDKLIETFQNNKKIKKYMTYDVLSLGLLFHKFQKAISNIFGSQLNFKQIDHYKTIGGVMMEIVEKDHKNKKISLPGFQKEQMKLYKDLQKNKVGGRCELFSGMTEILEKIISLDASSMYCYAMAIMDIYYPCGDSIIECKKFEEKPENKIGFFYCDVDQTKLRKNKLPNICPEKGKDKSNDWDTKNILKNILISTVKIEDLQKHGADVKIKNGFYFPERVKSCEMFESILPLMNLKNQQDVLKDKNSLEYNESLRATLKLLINIVSGKFAEGLHVNQTKIIKADQAEEIRLKYPDMVVEKIIEHQAIITYKKDESECIKTSRPIYIGILIYDYTHRFMYDNIYSKINKKDRIYTDTDSMKVTQSTFDKWFKYGSEKIIPHWEAVEKYDPRYRTHKLFSHDSKVCGSFVDEYKNNHNDYSLYMDKKCYFTGIQEETRLQLLQENKDYDFSKEYKIICKGINKNDCWVKSQNEVAEIQNMSVQDRYAKYNTMPNIESEYIQFFRCMYTQKKVSVLTSNLRKDKNSISINYTCRIKTITI